MAKPLFRWTLGPCLLQGIEILGESIKQTTKALGIDTFDWVICYNGVSDDHLEKVRRYIGDLPIHLFKQNWDHAPIPDNIQTPQKEDGSFEWNGNNCGGTLWKVCPPRMRMEAHEIIMDNDVIVLKKIPQINYFLKSDNMALILEEPIRFYGRYDNLFPEATTYLNSGFMGFPPGYDFGAEIYRVWEEYGKLMNLSQADEQGLLTYTLSRLPSIRIKKTQMKECLARDFSKEINDTDEMFHLTQANKIPSHVTWKKYKKKFGLTTEKSEERLTHEE